jgi:prepilin-type processing-associated H-X9-DG protein
VGILAAASISAIYSAREADRRNQCARNAARLAWALQRYDDAHTFLPAGVRDASGPIASAADGLHHGWMTEILPYVDQRIAYLQLDRDQSVYADANVRIRRLAIEAFRCPGQASAQDRASGYAGVHHDSEAAIDADQDGMLFLNSRIRRDDVSDGLAYTLILGEKLIPPDDLGWMSGTRATLRNTGAALNATHRTTLAVPGGAGPLFVGGFAGPHAGGVNFAFGDGRVQFLADAVDVQLLRQLGHRADGLPAETYK